MDDELPRIPAIVSRLHIRDYDRKPSFTAGVCFKDSTSSECGKSLLKDGALPESREERPEDVPADR